MNKFVLNFGNFLIFFLAFANPLFAGVPFSISGAPGPSTNGPVSLDDPTVLTELVTQLKQRAVQEWLQGQLGERYPQFEKSVTPDFSERYVLDYKVGRTGPRRDTLELTGHLDSESLKKWIRIQDTRKGTTSIKPLLLFSSTLPNFSFTPTETGEKFRDTPLGQTLLALLGPVFQKINSKPISADRSCPISQPAKFDSELGVLRDYSTQMGANAAIWVHLQPCDYCGGGVRVDLLLYSIPGQRIALAESDDLNAKPQEWGNPERLKAVLTPLMGLFLSGVEGLVSSGFFYAQTMKVAVDGVQSYRVFKALDAEFAQSDYASSSSLKKVGAKYAEFELLTQLSAEELAQRIQGTDFAGLRVKAQKFDSRTVVVRYGK